MESLAPAVRARTRCPQSPAGLTLIELLVVMAIIGTLAAITYPTYINYIVRLNRAAAKSCMAQAAHFMERYYTTNLTYAGALPVMGCATDGGLDRHYTFSVANLAARTFTLTATPINVQSSRDTRCGSLTLNNASVRGVSGTSDLDYCWSR